MTTISDDRVAVAARQHPHSVPASVVAVTFRPWAGWAARAAIVGRARSRTDPGRGRFTRADLRRLLGSTWTRFSRLAPDLPSEPTVGSRQNVALAALTLAMLEALLEEGIERTYAIELVGDACWKVYAQWGRLPRLMSCLKSRDPLQRVRTSVNLFLRFPFNPPGYLFEDQPEPQGRALDIDRCPVSDYLVSRGAGDLAVGSWCNLDFELARMWGGTLERSGSLAGGAPLCDFRFKVALPSATKVGLPTHRVDGEMGALQGC
ncbi:MAG TPA: L-2-amino-thiazoline-4-carboxylic acid hydrolase [Acidimicrobiales bacterium]|nr:L-2-amino-thiazoline-4-carboxylic acid hydrolase [Acidimicrobiales bacterium]